MGRDHPVLGCDVAASASLDELAERVLRLERIVEQIGCVLLPQNMKDILEGVQHVPLERVQNSVVEQIVGAPTPQTWEPLVEGVQVIPQEHVPYRIPDPIVGVSVRQTTEDGFPVVPQERVQNRLPEQIMDSSMPQMVEERVQNRKHEQIVDSLVPQIVEAGVQVLFSSPQERVQNRPVPQINTKLGDSVQPVPHERTHERIVKQISVVHQTTEKIVSAVQSVPSERIQERLVDVGFIKGLDRYNMPRPGDVVVPVPQIMEAAAEVLHAPQECVLRSRSSVRLCLRSWRPPWKLCVLHHKSVVNRTPEQLVDEPVPQIAEQLVEGPVPLERIPVPSQRELHEALRWFHEQYALEEEEEDEEEDDEEEEISRFPPHFRPRRWCRFVVEGACCPYGSKCTVAHQESGVLLPVPGAGKIYWGHGAAWRFHRCSFWTSYFCPLLMGAAWRFHRCSSWTSYFCPLLLGSSWRFHRCIFRTRLSMPVVMVSGADGRTVQKTCGDPQVQFLGKLSMSVVGVWCR